VRLSGELRALPHPSRPAPSRSRNNAVERIYRPDQDPAFTTWLGEERSKGGGGRARVERIRGHDGGWGGTWVECIGIDR